MLFKIKFNSFPSLEAQISAISDDIAYNNHDIQDGIKANLFKMEELVEIDFFKNIHKKYNNKFLNETLSAYGLAFHRHNSEIDQELKIKTGKKVKFQFTPHLSPMFRGILTTMYLDLKRNDSLKEIYSFLKKYYKNNKFIKILKPNTFLGTNEVINTNNCHISICESKYKNKIIILSAIDNLIKGGSGQAVQNMNILFGYKSDEGLN